MSEKHSKPPFRVIKQRKKIYTAKYVWNPQFELNANWTAAAKDEDRAFESNSSIHMFSRFSQILNIQLTIYLKSHKLLKQSLFVSLAEVIKRETLMPDKREKWGIKNREKK